MSELSDHAEALVLDWLFTTDSVTRPTAWYLALTTGAISDAETGSNLGGSTEISGNGYSRQGSIAFSRSGSTMDNDSALSFTASGDWGTIAYCAICDASSGGNMLCHTPLDTSRSVNDGETLQFAAGDVDITLA